MSATDSWWPLETSNSTRLAAQASLRTENSGSHATTKVSQSRPVGTWTPGGWFTVIRLVSTPGEHYFTWKHTKKVVALHKDYLRLKISLGFGSSVTGTVASFLCFWWLPLPSLCNPELNTSIGMNCSFLIPLTGLKNSPACIFMLSDFLRWLYSEWHYRGNCPYLFYCYSGSFIFDTYCTMDVAFHLQ